MSEWIDQLRSALDSHGKAVLVVIARARGSTPRQAGTKMVVWQDGFSGTIGGGNLEFAAIDRARLRLKEDGESTSGFEEFSLGPALGQCCGGSVTLFFQTLSVPRPGWIDEAASIFEKGERFLFACTSATGNKLAPIISLQNLALIAERDVQSAAKKLLESKGADVFFKKRSHGGSFMLEAISDQRSNLFIFGAGHVGRAIAAGMGGLPFRTVWLDPRPAEFLDMVPSNVETRLLTDLEKTLTAAEPGGYFLVLTHSHPLDLAVCEAVLRRGDFTYLGLIGSATKKERFRRQLAAAGLASDLIERMTCPIGIEGITGKAPAEIAVSVTAQLLRLREETARIKGNRHAD